MRFLSLSLLMAMAFLYGSSQSPSVPDSRPFPSALELMTGEYASPKDASVSPYADSPLRHPLEPALLALAGGKLSAAKDTLMAMDNLATHRKPMEVRFLLLAVEYLDKFTESGLSAPSNAPLFEGFNGGFARYVEQGLRWDTLRVLPKPVLDTVLVTWMEVLHRGQATCPGIYYEMYGDLMLRFDNVTMSRWISAMAYLRAAAAYGNDTITDRYKTKAIYAMESHQRNPTTFNRYRFNQLKESFDLLYSEGEQRRKTGAGPASPGSMTPLYTFDLLPEKAGHPIVDLIEKDREISGEIVEGDPNRESMNRDISVKKIKQVPIHNAFAISMILIVILSGVYFYVRLRRRQRELDAEDLRSDQKTPRN